MENILKSKDIVRKAWEISGLSQCDFAKLIKKSQPMLSKYISGAAQPPSDIIILCMNKCGLLESEEISANALAQRIRTELAGKEYSRTRSAISQLIDSVSEHNVVKPLNALHGITNLG